MRAAEELLLRELVTVEDHAPLAPAELEQVCELGADLLRAPAELPAGELRRDPRAIQATAGAHGEATAAPEVLQPPHLLVPDAVHDLRGHDALVPAQHEPEPRVLVDELEHLLGARTVPVDEPRRDRRRHPVRRRQPLDVRHRLAAG